MVAGSIDLELVREFGEFPPAAIGSGTPKGHCNPTLHLSSAIPLRELSESREPLGSDGEVEREPDGRSQVGQIALGPPLESRALTSTGLSSPAVGAPST